MRDHTTPCSLRNWTRHLAPWSHQSVDCASPLQCTFMRAIAIIELRFQDGGTLLARDGHIIPKCSPRPSVVFLYHRIHPSISVFFFRVRVRMSVIRTAKDLKIGKIGEKIHVSVYKKPRSPYFLKNVTKSLNCRRCDI